MKPKRVFEPHLVLQEFALPPGDEMSFPGPGWYLVQLTAGFGYWLRPGSNHDLVTGSVLVFCEPYQARLRASQVGPVQIRFFRFQPERLTGLLSFGEQQFFARAAAHEPLGVRWFAPGSCLAETFARLGREPPCSPLLLRLGMVQLFAEVFAPDLPKQASPGEPALKAKDRLMRLLRTTPAAELLELNFAELVRHAGCTPRHLSRIFQQVVGMSFREQQTQLRLRRAQELLATTESKVAEVALESGYESPCLFHLMFKRRFGVPPGKWREQSRRARSGRGQAFWLGRHLAGPGSARLTRAGRTPGGSRKGPD